MPQNSSPMHDSVAPGTIIILFKGHDMCLGRGETPHDAFYDGLKSETFRHSVVSDSLRPHGL